MTGVTGVTADISALGKPKLEEKIYYYLGFLRPNNGAVTPVTEGPRDAGVTTSLERVLDVLTANRYGGRMRDNKSTHAGRTVLSDCTRLFTGPAA